MKRYICLFLSLALCLTLVGCGVDEKYTALLEHLNTGNYNGIKNELNTLSAEFAAEQEKLAQYHKYESLIDSLESEDFEAAAADFASRIPTTPEPTYHAQEINMDNWETYFQLVAIEDWSINGFGEAESYSVYYKLKLRDEYLADIQFGTTKISAELQYSAHYYEANADLEMQEITIGEIVTNISGRPTGECSDVNELSWMDEHGYISTSAYSSLIVWDTGWQTIYLIEEMPTISRIKGTIYLLDQ